MGLKQTTTIDKTASILQSKNKVALFAHTNPDGDSIGACVALKLILERLGKTVAIFCDSELSNVLASFEQTKSISKVFCGKYDLLVAVDCSDIYRLGEFSGLYASFTETLTIDHHGDEYFSKHNCVYKEASTCSIIYRIAKAMNVSFDAELATYLYMGLCTDTGNFAHSNTDSDSFYIAGDLYKYGADIERVYGAFFRDIDFAQTKLIGKAVSRLRSYYDGKMFLTYVTKRDLDELGLDHTSTSGIVSYAINIITAKVGVCLCEFSPNSYKVSMRGKKYSVRDVCKEFGGGGHLYASGCKINGLLEDVIEKIVRVVGFTI